MHIEATCVAASQCSQCSLSLSLCPDDKRERGGGGGRPCSLARQPRALDPGAVQEWPSERALSLGCLNFRACLAASVCALLLGGCFSFSVFQFVSKAEAAARGAAAREARRHQESAGRGRRVLSPVSSQNTSERDGVVGAISNESVSNLIWI